MTTDVDTGGRGRSHIGRKTVITVAVLVVVAGIGVGAALLVGHGGSDNKHTPPPAVRTVAVRKMDMTRSTTIAGMLGYGPTHALKGRGSGILTKLPEPGTTAVRGKPLFWVDGKPVPVFFGDTPLYRKLDTPNMYGPDIAMVASNLAELGYATGVRARDPQKATLTPRLVGAIKAWQRRVGLEPTGSLDIGQIVVVPGPVRVDSVSAALGDPVGGTIMSVTSTNKVVTAPVDATEAGALKVGTKATIIRPDNKEVPGKITRIGTETVKPKGSTDAGQGQPPKLNLTVTPLDAHRLADLTYAAVQVRITTVSHPGVLAVPTGALVALREGGYAVQLPNGQLEAVRTGAFSRGMVEISGKGITAGLRVVTTS